MSGRWGGFILLALAGCASPAPYEARPVSVAATPVPLDPAAPVVARAGRLRYLGGLTLTSPDPLFGGLSSLRWHEGKLFALSDQDGAWFVIEPIERDGRLIGIGSARMIRLRGADGVPLTGQMESDAESINLTIARCRTPPCRIRRVSVGLERHDRILTYRVRGGFPVGKPRALRGIDGWLGRQPSNLGIEAMAGDEFVTLLISEGLRTAAGDASALLFRPGLAGRARPAAPPVEIGVPAPDEARPSDLAQIDARTFILLRRSWSEAAGFATRVELLTLDSSELPRATTTPLASLGPPLQTDNYEGVAVRREGGRTCLYIVSDDNFDRTQRTLLLKFEIVE